MKRIVVLLAACLLLTGCSMWTNGSYVFVSPHEIREQAQDTEEVITNEDQLYDALCSMIHRGAAADLFLIRDYDQTQLSGDIVQAEYRIRKTDPIGAYALDKLSYELGVNGGQSTLAVNMTYTHSRGDILRIRKVWGPSEAKASIRQMLQDMDTELVLYVDNYQQIDFAQVAEDYAQQQPDIVMEIPKVSVSVFPEEGSARVVEIKCSYEMNRDALRDMQSQVRRVFDSAELYVSSDESVLEQLTHLYNFLMERFDYQIQTSITPAYSLLRHGVGDSRAFANVYGAMCRQAELECITVSGTKDGEPWTWNIVRDGEYYYHVDLLRCLEEGAFQERSDEEMQGYVWDYSAYPACGNPQEPSLEEAEPSVPEETQPAQAEPETENTEAVTGETTTAPEETAAPPEPSEALPEI